MKKNHKDNTDRGLINPFIDWSFKYLFGREETKDLLIGFLNLLLQREYPITDITYLNNERIPEQSDGRECVFDVICRDGAGDRFLVEMQQVPKTNIRNRLLYYACRLIDQMGHQGEEWDYEYDRVYAICLMDFTYERNPVLRSDYLLRDNREGKVFTDRLNVITLQLPCIQAQNFEECVESYEKLLYLLITMKEDKKTLEDILADIEAETSSEEIKAMLRRVAQTADKASLSPEDRVAYDYAVKRKRDYYSGLKTAREEGLAEGADQKMREIARAMKAGGEPAEKISFYTGLPLSEITNL